jgi:hypothetical protein
LIGPDTFSFRSGVLVALFSFAKAKANSLGPPLRSIQASYYYNHLLHEVSAGEPNSLGNQSLKDSIATIISHYLTGKA